MELLQIGLGITIFINLILIYGIRNLIRQNEQLEDKVVNTIYETRNKVQNALEKMYQLDTKQAFEKDDEVGVTFDGLKKIVEELNEEL
jgi:hypothetical protein